MPSRGWATYYVVILTAMLSLNLMDRQLLAVVAEPIKIEFALTDTQLGLLTGLIFAGVFALASIPVAWLADHANRVAILTVCGTLWSLTTLATGVVNGFSQMVLTRAGLAVGESGCHPCAVSLIAGYVPVERRGRALAIYSMAGPIGFLVVGIVGGGIADHFGWRGSFLALGAASLVVAFLAATTLPEPKRVPAPEGETRRERKAYRQILAKASYRNLLLGAAFAGVATYGIAAWANVFAIRYFGWTPGQVGAVFGTLGTIAGLFGTWLGGRLSDWLSPKDTRWLMWVPALAGLLAIPFDAAGAFANSVTVLFVTSPVGVLFRTLPLAPVAAAIQRLAADDVRARAAATVGVLGTLMGLGIGPTVVGFLSDALKPLFLNDALRIGLVALVVPQALCAYHFLRAARSITHELIE
ncbi:MAG: MFS transporter [Alphaproteobacteria bacterium]|nr:MFS transporter [Alphaproteobacteria bacterium]